LNQVAYTGKAAYRFLTAVFIISTCFAVYTGQFLFALIPFALLTGYAMWLWPVYSFLLLVATIPFSFEYSFSQTLGTDLPDEPLMILIAIVFMGYLLYKPAVISRNTWQHPLLLLLFLHLAWVIFTVITSTDPLLSLKFFLAKSWYVAAFFFVPLIVFRDPRWIRVTAILLLGGIVIVSCIAMVRHAQLGFRFAVVNETVVPFFRNHVNYSAMLVCLLPIGYASYRLSTNKKTRNYLIVILILLLIALLFSYARGAWLALGTGIIAGWLTRHRLLFKGFIIAFVLIVTTTAWLQYDQRYLSYAHDYRTTIFHENFAKHLQATYKLKDVSTAERFYRWIAGLRMSREKPLTGFGPNTFYDNYRPYAIPAYKTWVSGNPEHSTVHNYYLLLLTEQGYPGLLIFLLLLGGMLFYGERNYHRNEDQFNKTVSLSLVAMIVMIATLNFLSDLIETDKIGSLFFLCLSTLIITSSLTAGKPPVGPERTKSP
jgi:O-antigen ligase